MASMTFEIAAGADDGVAEGTDTFYPPVGDYADATVTDFGVQKNFFTPNYVITNALMRWDTSALPNDATVTAATLEAVLTYRGSAGDSRSIVFEWYDAGTIAIADYSSTVVSDAHTGTPWDFWAGLPIVLSFPLQNLENISKTGYTGLRGHVSGGTPTGENTFWFAALEHATSAPPKLIVTYTVPGPQFDLATEFERTATTDPQTWTHTTTASPKGVVVAIVHGTSSTDHVSTVTYGGVSLGEVVRAVDTTTEAGAAELWFLGSGIPTGNQTVSVDLASATTDDIHFICFSVTANADTEVIDFDSLQAENANPTVTMSKAGRLGWSVAAMYGGGAAPGGTLSADNTLGPIFDIAAFYSQSCYETTTDTADHTIGWSTLGGDDLAFVALCLAEVATAAPSLIYRPRPMIRNI